jgi:hypothetical protein
LSDGGQATVEVEGTRREPSAPAPAPALESQVVVQPRLVVALLLILGGIVWAILRGLNFYGLGPVDVVYDLDQPPLLLVFVGAWLAYRSRLP